VNEGEVEVLNKELSPCNNYKMENNFGPTLYSGRVRKTKRSNPHLVCCLIRPVRQQCLMPIYKSLIYYLTVSFKFYDFSFQIYLLLFLKCLLASRLILHRLSTLFGLDPVVTAL
jgi:hypothetical protein